MDTVSVIGSLAALCSMASFAPQALKVVRTCDTDGLSLRMYTITVCAFSLWLAYGLLKSDVAIIVTNAVCLSLAAFILVMKILPGPRKQTVANFLCRRNGMRRQPEC